MEKFLKQNWFKVSALVVGILIIAVLSLKPSHQRALSTETSAANATQSQINASVSDLALQGQCAEDADNLFKNVGSLVNSDSGSNGDTYQNHFNQNLDTCFVVISDANHNFITQDLFDANSRQEYGGYSQPELSALGGTIFDCTQDSKPLPIADCKIVSPNKATLGDWQNFIKPYMEN